MELTPSRSVTLEQVARAAGVSPATASRVVTGVGPSSATARRRVEEAVAALGYVPHPVARSLARGLGHRLVVAVVGVQRSVLADPYVARVTAAAAEVADAHGLGAGLRWVPVGGAHGRVALEDLGRDRSVSAVVVVNHTQQLLESLPSALAGRTTAIGTGTGDVPGFDVDSPSGVEGLLRHLHSDGRREIVLATGPSWVAAARRPLQAHRAFMHQVGLPVRTVAGNFTAERGRAAVQRALDRWPDTDAVIALSDVAAFGVLAALAESGIAVPDDVAVAGFDDVPMAALAGPGLTTATHPVEAIAASAAECALEGAVAPTPLRIFPSEVVVRHSA